MVSFKAPCSCSETEAIQIEGENYTVCDAMGKPVTGTSGIWDVDSIVTVVLSPEQKKAYVQNNAGYSPNNKPTAEDCGARSNTWLPTPTEIGAAASVHKHAAGDITSGTLSSDRLPTVPVAKGGTGATTAKGAEFAISGGISEATASLTDDYRIAFVHTAPSATQGVFLFRKVSTVWAYLKGKADALYAAATHKHAAGDITSGTLAVARGGTGVTSNPSMLTNLGSTTAASVFATSPRPGVTGVLPAANGGTGVTSIDALKASFGGPWELISSVAININTRFTQDYKSMGNYVLAPAGTLDVYKYSHFRFVLAGGDLTYSGNIASTKTISARLYNVYSTGYTTNPYIIKQSISTSAQSGTVDASYRTQMLAEHAVCDRFWNGWCPGEGTTSFQAGWLVNIYLDSNKRNSQDIYFYLGVSGFDNSSEWMDMVYSGTISLYGVRAVK